MKFRKRYVMTLSKEEGRFYIERRWEVVGRTRLSDGQILRLSFSVDDWNEDKIIEPHLVVHKPFSMDRWSKQGEATGPGGMEVWAVVIENFEAGVAVTRKKLTKRNEYVEIEVTAATDALFRIYRHFLMKRGYLQQPWQNVLYKEVPWPV